MVAGFFTKSLPPVVVTSHGGDLYGLKGYALNRLKRYVLLRSSAVTVVSPGGDRRELQPCPFADTDSSRARLIMSLRAGGFDEAATFLQNAFSRSTSAQPSLANPIGRPTSPVTNTTTL